MVLSILTTTLLVPAVTLFLLNAAITQGYAGKVPGGSSAMGLVLPVFMAIGGSALLVLATWTCLARGGLDWIGTTRGIPTIVGTAVSLGIGLAATGVLIAWMERMGTWVPTAGVVCGLLGPMLLAALLLAGAWVSPESVTASPVPKLAGAALALIALIGFGLGSYGLTRHLQQSARNARETAKSNMQRDQKWAAIRARTPMEALRADYAEMSPDAPLWVFVASLPDRSEPDCRNFIIERALKVPDFDVALARTLTDDHPRYRHGCADLIRFMPADQVRAAWSAPLTRAIRITAEQIRSNPMWLTPDDFANPHPASHLQALVEAATRVSRDRATLAALTDLQAAIEATGQSDLRDAALAAVHPDAPAVPSQ